MRRNEHAESAAPTAGNAGFTLVELAIVLVIVGLIITGVLTGLDMIKNSEVRATVGQIERYRAATGTFITKYNGLPGDLDATRAAAYGLTALAGTGGLGDGDKVIEGAGNVTGSATTGDGESTLYWQHLTEARLVDGSYDGAQGPGTAGVTFPLTKLRQSGIAVFNSAGRNYFQIGAVASDAGVAISTQDAMTPQEAFNIDNKMDDGLPDTGQVRAVTGTVLDTAPSSYTAADCTAAAGGDYRKNLTTVVCQLRMRMD